MISPLSHLGWDAAWAATASSYPADQPGRIIRADRGGCVVRTASGEHQCHYDNQLAGAEQPVTGDWVLVAGDVVTAVLPRRTAFVRGAGRRDTRAQVLAANLDVVLVAESLAEAPNLSRLERLLALAWQSGAQPVIVLTKADLSTTAETERVQVAESAPGVEVLLASVVDGRGLDELRAVLPSTRTGALLGVSGAGKSSLVNALVGAELLATQELRGDGKGRHTSVTRELVALPWGGLLIDTPGLRGVQLWDAEDGLDRTFPDIVAIAEQCRFADCRHDSEPGCAIRTALADGRLSTRRYESHERLMREQAWLAGRYDARLRAEQRRVWKQRTKANRQGGKR